MAKAKENETKWQKDVFGKRGQQRVCGVLSILALNARLGRSAGRTPLRVGGWRSS